MGTSMTAHYKILLRVDAEVNLRDVSSLITFFGTRLAMRVQTPEPDPAEVEKAVHAMSIADALVDVFSDTPGYQCVGTQTYSGHNVVLVGTHRTPQAFEWLFDRVNELYVDPIPGTPFMQWKVVAAQTYDASTREQDVLDEFGEPTGETETVTVGDTYREVPQSLLPWLTPDYDEQDNPVAKTEVKPQDLGNIMGATPWVVEVVV